VKNMNTPWKVVAHVKPDIEFKTGYPR